MSAGCPVCGGAYKVAQDNGVTDPSQDRFELWRCVECKHEKTVMLKA